MSRLLRPDEAAARLGVTPSTLRRYAAAGRVQASRTPGGHYRYVAADLDRLANRYHRGTA